MTDHSWFRLLVRAIGLVLIGIALPGICWHLGSVIMLLTTDRGSAPPDLGMELLRYVPHLLGTVAQAAFGYYLLFHGAWVIRRCLHEVRGRCAWCGYDLANVTSGKCPECGTEFRAPRPEGPSDSASS